MIDFIPDDTPEEDLGFIPDSGPKVRQTLLNKIVNSPQVLATLGAGDEMRNFFANAIGILPGMSWAKGMKVERRPEQNDIAYKTGGAFGSGLDFLLSTALGAPAIKTLIGSAGKIGPRAASLANYLGSSKTIPSIARNSALAAGYEGIASDEDKLKNAALMGLGSAAIEAPLRVAGGVGGAVLGALKNSPLKLIAEKAQSLYKNYSGTQEDVLKESKGFVAEAGKNTREEFGKRYNEIFTPELKKKEMISNTLGSDLMQETTKYDESLSKMFRGVSPEKLQKIIPKDTLSELTAKKRVYSDLGSDLTKDLPLETKTRLHKYLKTPTLESAHELHKQLSAERRYISAKDPNSRDKIQKINYMLKKLGSDISDTLDTYVPEKGFGEKFRALNQEYFDKYINPYRGSRAIRAITEEKEGPVTQDVTLPRFLSAFKNPKERSSIKEIFKTANPKLRQNLEYLALGSPENTTLTGLLRRPGRLAEKEMLDLVAPKSLAAIKEMQDIASSKLTQAHSLYNRVIGSKLGKILAGAGAASGLTSGLTPTSAASLLALGLGEIGPKMSDYVARAAVSPSRADKLAEILARLGRSSGKATETSAKTILARLLSD